MNNLKVLEITSELDGGGVERLLYDYCSRMISDISFDFIVVSEHKGILEEKLERLGCRIFRVVPVRKNFLLHINQIRQVLSNTRYDIIHDHSGYKAFLNLWIAKKKKVAVRIAHAHIAFAPERVLQKLLRKVVTPITKHYATDLYACGKDAAVWMWGNISNVTFMTNAIEAEKFSYSKVKRYEIRKELGLENCFVVGNVARFSYQKNHEFLLQIFVEIQKIKDNAVLLLVGRGELMETVSKLADSLGIKEKVRILGVRDDVADLLNAIDIFVFPSRYEGIGIAVIEAQANGLPCIVSDKVPQETNISGSMRYLALEAGTFQWAKQCCGMEIKRSANKIIGSKYDINIAVEQMKENYITLINKKGI